MKDMQPYILGYAMPRGLLLLNEEDAGMLTHLNIAFGLIRDGMLSMEGLQNLGSHLHRIRSYERHPRIVLSIGGWGAGGFSLLSRTAEGRRRFVTSVRNIVQYYHFDGVDIDWEYPCSGVAGIDYAREDRENFTYLLQDLREMLSTQTLSIAAGGGPSFVEDTEIEKIAKICDYVQLMTYDLRSGLDEEAGHHAALYASDGDTSGKNADACVRMFHDAGVPFEKMVLGAAFYGRRWDGVQNVNHGIMQTAQTIGYGAGGYASLMREVNGKHGFVQYWDDTAKASYYFNGSSLISFEDPQALRYKCEYVLAHGLRGIMYWEHGCDDTHTLLRVMHESLYRS